MNPVLAEFRSSCCAWYSYGRSRNCYPARQVIYDILLQRHSYRTVIRHANAIKIILDRAEAEVAADFLPSGLAELVLKKPGAFRDARGIAGPAEQPAEIIIRKIRDEE